ACERFAQVVYSLERRQAVALSGSDAELIEAMEVSDPFSSSEALVKAVEWVKHELTQFRPYLFVPNLDPAAEDHRVHAFLGQDVHQDVEDDGEEPAVAAEAAADNNPLL